MADFPDVLSDFIRVEHREWYLEHWRRNVGKTDELQRRSDELKKLMEKARWLESQIDVCENWHKKVIATTEVSTRHAISNSGHTIVGPRAVGDVEISVNEVLEFFQHRKERFEVELSKL